MGLRSWLTRIDDEQQFDSFMSALSANDDAFGVSYAVNITTDNSMLSKGVWIAWSGDTNASLTEGMPQVFFSKTVLLDTLGDAFNPTQHGALLAPVDVETVLKQASGLSVC